MRNTLVMESDVMSSMMGEICRQLASAQLRGRLYKTGYRRMKAVPKEVQTGVTGQSAAIAAGCRVGTVATGGLVTVPRAPISAQMVAMTSSNNSVPQTPIISMKQIQDKTPQTITTIKQEMSNVTMTASAQKVAVAVKKRGRPKSQPVATCQVLDTIEEVNEDSPVLENTIVSTDPLKEYNNNNSNKSTSLGNLHTVILKMWRRVNIKIQNSTIMVITVMK